MSTSEPLDTLSTTHSKKQLSILMFSGIIVLGIMSTSCVENFKSIEPSNQTNLTAGTGTWAQGEVYESLPEPTEGSANGFCSIYIPADLTKDQELRVTVLSRGVAQVQVRVGPGDFIGFATLNGILRWSGGSFPAGTYPLHFRGLKTDGTSVPCEPESKSVTIRETTSGTVPVIPMPTTPPPANGGSGAVIDRNYVSLTGYSYPGSGAAPITNTGFKNFKEIYKPDSSMLTDMGSNGAPGEKCYLLRTRHSTNLSGVTKMRVYLPPGTKRFNFSTLTYYEPSTDQAAAFRFNAPPVSTYEQSSQTAAIWSADPKRNLEYIVNGQEYAGRSGLGANLMPFFGPAGNDYLNKYTYKTTRGGWLYINFLRIVGQNPLNMDTSTCVDPADYESWYRNAQWDQDGNPL